MQKDQMLDLILSVQLKLRISMYVNYVKSDFVVFFRQDKDTSRKHAYINLTPLNPTFIL